MRKWYWIVGLTGFLAGSLVWEMRADYAPLAGMKAPRTLGFVVVVHTSGVCEVLTADMRPAATFECRPVGGW